MKLLIFLEVEEQFVVFQLKKKQFLFQYFLIFIFQLVKKPKCSQLKGQTNIAHLPNSYPKQL
jgi:hypothetical protein